MVTLSTQDNANVLQQLKLGLKRTINWSKYQSKLKINTSNPIFQGVNRLFTLLFENTTYKPVHRKHSSNSRNKIL